MSADLDKLYKENGTIVFIVGAGCSVDCGAPTMQQFMRKAREYRRRPDCEFKNDYDAMFDFRQECLRVSYVFNRWWDNIEDLYTQAHLRLLAGTDGAQELCDSMAKAIWDVYRKPHSVRDAVGYDMLANYLYALVRRARKEKTPYPVLVTTNYDLHLEASLVQKAHVHPSVERPDGHSFTVAYPEGLNAVLLDEPNTMGLAVTGPNEGVDMGEWPPLIELMKLHGSVNWFLYHSKGKTKVVADFGIEEIDRVRGSGEVPVFECQKPGNSPRGIPLIVPPMLGKTAMHEALETQWSRTISVLEQAHLIVIMGYSFPETDTFMSRLMAEGIGKGRNLEGIVICNRSKKPEFERRIKDLFARGWLDNCVDVIQQPFDMAMRRAILHIGALDKPLSFSSGEKLLRDYAGIGY